jgi:hypothetical protein
VEWPAGELEEGANDPTTDPPTDPAGDRSEESV